MMPKPTQAPQESELQSQGRFAMVPAAGSIGNHGDESGVHGALNQRTIHLSYCGYILIFLLSLTSVTAFATDSPSPQTVASLKSESRPAALPFFVGEKLLFEVRWMGFLAGNASMAVSGQVTRNGHDVYHIRSLAESSPFFSLFYNVRDMGETFVDVRELYPWYFRLDQREGARSVQRTVTFDQQRGVAIYTKNQETPQEVKIPWGVQDSLSSFYLVRTLPLRVGQSIHLKTFSNGKTYDLEVQILRREKVEAYWGPVDALVVQPLMRFQEILRQKGDVLIWVTDDDRRLPVRMKTAIKVGSIEATLINVKSIR
jgi:Protein of unknown function (DUF3108)